MLASPEERFGKLISQEQYESDKKALVIPEELSAGEFYQFRHLVAEKERQLGAWAVENLVTIKFIQQEEDYYTVDFEWMENQARREQPHPVLLMSSNGLVFAEREFQKRLEDGYLLGAKKDWDEAFSQLLTTTKERVPGIVTT